MTILKIPQFQDQDIVDPSSKIRRSLIMADDESYLSFLQRANQPTNPPSVSTETTTSLSDNETSKHPFVPLLNNKLANLSEGKTFTTETDSDFHAIFISSSALPSWSDTDSAFPKPEDLEAQVDGGRKGKMMSVNEWDKRGEFTAVVKVIKDITKRNEVKVYTVNGRGGRFEVFILAKMDDGLAGVKAMGVAT
jgi:hypothetical protein